VRHLSIRAQWAPLSPALFRHLASYRTAPLYLLAEVPLSSSGDGKSGQSTHRSARDETQSRWHTPGCFSGAISGVPLSRTSGSVPADTGSHRLSSYLLDPHRRLDVAMLFPLDCNLVAYSVYYQPWCYSPSRIARPESDLQNSESNVRKREKPGLTSISRAPTTLNQGSRAACERKSFVCPSAFPQPTTLRISAARILQVDPELAACCLSSLYWRKGTLAGVPPYYSRRVVRCSSLLILCLIYFVAERKVCASCWACCLVLLRSPCCSI